MMGNVSRAPDSATGILVAIFFLCVNMRVMMMLTSSIPICHLRSHSLVCIKNRLFIVGIGPIPNKELGFIYRSDRSDITFVYS